MMEVVSSDDEFVDSQDWIAENDYLRKEIERLVKSGAEEISDQKKQAITLESES